MALKSLLEFWDAERFFDGKILRFRGATPWNEYKEVNGKNVRTENVLGANVKVSIEEDKTTYEKADTTNSGESFTIHFEGTSAEKANAHLTEQDIIGWGEITKATVYAPKGSSYVNTISMTCKGLHVVGHLKTTISLNKEG